MLSLLLPVIYLAFISLGLPDGLLGAAWPTVYKDFDVSVSYAGLITFIICLGTITSSLLSDRLTHRFGTGKVTFFSVLLTAVAIFGFSFADSFIFLCLWSVPYGIGETSDLSSSFFWLLSHSGRENNKITVRIACIAPTILYPKGHELRESA